MVGRSGPDRRRIAVGLLNKYLPPERRAVLVGGAAVEFYTMGGYVTGDVDLIGDRDAVRALLGEAGFEPRGRLMVREDLGLVLEVQGLSLRPTEEPVVAAFEDLTLLTLCVEDVIVDRLLAAKYCRSPTDWEQAVLLYRAHLPRIDAAKTLAKARSNDVEDYWLRLQDEANPNRVTLSDEDAEALKREAYAERDRTREPRAKWP